jgi:hypothetical protein
LSLSPSAIAAPGPWKCHSLNRRTVEPGQLIQLDMTSTLLYKVRMQRMRGAVAIFELLIILPAVLFMTALFVRNIQPAPYEPAQTARRLVEWFSGRPILGLDVFLIALRLDVFLIALPFAAIVIGCISVWRSWRYDRLSAFLRTS